MCIFLEEISVHASQNTIASIKYVIDFLLLTTVFVLERQYNLNSVLRQVGR
jgi:hypothetical protein